MKQIKLWMLAAILTICGTAAFASCATNDDNPTSDPVVTPAEVVLGEWYGQVMAGGMISNDKFYDLMFERPTEAQQQKIMEWGVIIDQWADIEGDDEGNTETEVTTNGAEEPGRARQY